MSIFLALDPDTDPNLDLVPIVGKQIAKGYQAKIMSKEARN
jgi:hypothetical protein